MKSFSSEDAKRLKKQYERFPYPPVSPLALPLPGQGKSLSYDYGKGFAKNQKNIPETPRRILIAGCGTLEPYVVAQQHPHAEEIVAIDFSDQSLQRFKARFLLSRATRFWQRLPKITLQTQDLEADLSSLGQFDYILASNVLHHLKNPAQALARLAKLLPAGGLLRVVTYPKMSRFWMTQTQAFFRSKGIHAETPRLRATCLKALQDLSLHDPIRLTFEYHSEIKQQAGLVDAFFNALENPLSPLQWGVASENAQLVCLHEDQLESSRSTFLDELAPECRSFSRWKKLQILDDLLEICHNPIFWFQKTDSENHSSEVSTLRALESQSPRLECEIRFQKKKVPFETEDAFFFALGRVHFLLQGSLEIPVLLKRLQNQVGPRTLAARPQTPVPGLALSDYEVLL